MTPFFDKVQRFSSALWQTSLSIVKIVLFSKMKITLPTCENQTDLVIMVNGPSLNKTVKEASEFWHSRPTMMVNFSPTSDLFADIKPRFCVMADYRIWLLPDQTEPIFNALNDKVDWELTLFMPTSAFKSKRWQDIIAGNKNITAYPYNAIPIEGFPTFVNWAYKKGLGVPRPHNVLIPCIMLGLNMPFDRVYIAGADHTWVQELAVNSNNVVVMNQKHYYDEDISQAKPVLDIDGKAVPLYNILYHQYVVFKAYFDVRNYAEYRKKRVINITPYSFIDAFEREKV